jgi:2-desacetyl-2-hydroxyethyl bacteriochlorophyllide A dehydrogenase
MRQIRLEEPLRFADRRTPAPRPAEGEALVRIRRVGVCGTDFHAFEGTQPIITFPRVLGHEIAAEVVEAPADERIKAGDRCAIEPYLSCGGCRACRMGKPNCCEHIRVLGVHVDGAMQGLLAVPVERLHASRSLSLDQLALVETLGIGAHAVRRGGVTRGESVLVVGAGPIGLAVTQFAQAEGATVRLIETSETRRVFASRFCEGVLPGWDGHVADVVFDATGNAASMAASLKYVGAGGRLVFVGVCRDAIAIDDPLLHTREVTLFASRNSRDQFPRIIRMIEEGRIDTRSWVTDRIMLGDVPRAFPDLRRRPTTIKALVEVEDSDLD